MQLNNDIIAQWEHIIAGVNKTDVPLECIKKVVIKHKDKRQKTINVALLRRNGMSLENIESILNGYFADNDSIIRDVDFIVDIQSVMSLIQPETDKLLGRL